MTDPYTFKATPEGGALMTRTSDGATIYFQPGDDANRVISQVETRGLAWLMRSFDYAELMDSDNET